MEKRYLVYSFECIKGMKIAYTKIQEGKDSTKVISLVLYSSIAQWQSTRLLTVGLLVRAQLGELSKKEEKKDMAT